MPSLALPGLEKGKSNDKVVKALETEVHDDNRTTLTSCSATITCCWQVKRLKQQLDEKNKVSLGMHLRGATSDCHVLTVVVPAFHPDIAAEPLIGSMSHHSAVWLHCN